MAAGGRLLAAGDPAVQIVQRGPQQGRVVHAVQRQLPPDAVTGAELQRREVPRPVLAASEVIAAH